MLHTFAGLVPTHWTPRPEFRVLALLLVVGCACAPLHDVARAETTAARVVTPVVETVAPDPAATTVPVPARAPSPRALEVQALLDQEKTSLDALALRLKAAPNDAAALEVQREIERVKAGTELGLLGLQATWARRDGREDAARAIEAAIEGMRAAQPGVVTPPAAARPSSVPAPAMSAPSRVSRPLAPLPVPATARRSR